MGLFLEIVDLPEHDDCVELLYQRTELEASVQWGTKKWDVDSSFACGKGRNRPEDFAL